MVAQGARSLKSAGHCDYSLDQGSGESAGHYVSSLDQGSGESAVHY